MHIPITTALTAVHCGVHPTGDTKCNLKNTDKRMMFIMG